jgi:hypothetical protein
MLSLAAAPLFAQRGGGHGAAVGGHGGMAAHGGFAGHSAGGQGFTGSHSGHSFMGRGFSGPGWGTHPSGHGPSFRQPLSSHNFNHFRDSRFRDRDSRFRDRDRDRDRDSRHRWLGYPWYGYGYGYPYYAYPYAGGGIDPYWWWDSGSSYDPDREREIALANEMNEQSLDEQRMRQQSDQDIYEPAAQRPQPARQSNNNNSDNNSDIVPPTVLVFRDQHKKEVQNFAIVGETVWIFAPQRTEKIPLSDLDLAATAKANDDRGVDFHIPGA